MLPMASQPKILLADFYILDHRTQEATSVLEPLRQVKDGYVPATLRLAAIDFAANKKPAAYAMIEEALKRAPQNEDALLEKGRFLISDGKPAETLALATAVVGRNPHVGSRPFPEGNGSTRQSGPMPRRSLHFRRSCGCGRPPMPRTSSSASST